jgi:hypothetical protein
MLLLLKVNIFFFFFLLLKSCRLFFYIDMSSSNPSSIADQNEQVPATIHHSESSDAPQDIIGSSVSSTATPMLADEVLTEDNHEDNLMELIDQVIRNFLSRNNRRSPYRSFFRWTFDDEPNLSYSVLVKIVAPSGML